MSDILENLRLKEINGTASLDELTAADEIVRLRAGLMIIIEAGGIHGAGWCVAQARGYLEDLDFNEFPETGKE